MFNLLFILIATFNTIDMDIMYPNHGYIDVKKVNQIYLEQQEEKEYLKELPMRTCNRRNLGSYCGKKVYLIPEAADAFMELVAQANMEGFEISINSSFRTREEQQRLYDRNPDIAAKPGTSKHEEGLAVDISGTIKKKRTVSKKTNSCEKSGGYYKCKTILFYWLRRNAPQYGFRNTVDNEEWHWEYIEPLEIGG